MPNFPLALVPLDNRPCNARFPFQIASIAGDELLLPKPESLGDLHRAGDAQSAADWIATLPEVSALIVSIDMLAYGGLVFSRRTLTTKDEALARLEALRQFRRQRPSTPILAFNVLMRLAVTMDSDAAATNYYNIMRFARLADEAERFDSQYLREQLQQVQSEIPPAALQEYLAARARNHAVNARMIEWLSEDVFDYLLITQEDAAEFGLHRREQDALLKKAGELNVENKMSLHPGADEAALTLLARHWNTGVKFRLHWSSLEDSRRIAPFEDRPFDVSLQQHIAAMRGVLSSDGDADFELFVNAPVGGSAKDEDSGPKALRAARVNAFAREIEKKIESEKRVALCDVAFPNGADDVLMNALDKRGLLGKLSAFGAWNTAGNTLGTVLAQCAAVVKGAERSRQAGHAPDESINRQFTFERILDDWFYQSRVRSRIEKTARDNGASPLDLQDQTETVEAQARRELRVYARLVAARHFGSTLEKCEVSLPWQRAFEVDFRAQLAPTEKV
jgi:hypothetical protein